MRRSRSPRTRAMIVAAAAAVAAFGCSDEETADVTHDGSCFVYEQTSLCADISWQPEADPVGWLRAGGNAVGIVAADTAELNLVRDGETSDLQSSPIAGRDERWFVVRDVQPGDEVNATAPSASANCLVPTLPPFESCTATQVVPTR